MMLTKDDQDRILLSEMQHLAETVHRRAYSHVPQWRVSADVRGVLSQLDNMTAGLIERAERLAGAISWIEPPFVDENTPCAELRSRVKFAVADAQAIEAQRAATVKQGAVADESAVVADDAPKGESS